MLSGSATRLQATWLLLLYNLIFVLPFIIITLGVTLGVTSIERLQRFQQENLERLHFVIGLVMLLLGITMIVLVLCGKI